MPSNHDNGGPELNLLNTTLGGPWLIKFVVLVFSSCFAERGVACVGNG